MRFLANENFPAPSILLLENTGFEVLSISAIKSGASDFEVLDIAIKKNAIILTFDNDYGEIIFRIRPVIIPSVVFFRDKGANANNAGERLIKIISLGVELDGYYTTIESKSVRQRKITNLH